MEPSFNGTIIPPALLPPNQTVDARESPAGLACMGGTKGKSTKHMMGEWSHNPNLSPSPNPNPSPSPSPNPNPSPSPSPKPKPKPKPNPDPNQASGRTR